MTPVDAPQLTLSSTRIRLAPGGQERIPVLVRNPGQRMETFHVDVVGLEDHWWEVEPAEIELSGGEESTVLLVLQPPDNAPVSEDAMPFGVRGRATSLINQRCSAVEEGDLEVARVLDLQAVIRPVTSRGRWWAKHRVVYTNWGDADARIRISAHGADTALGFRIVPEELVVPVGGSASAYVRVKLNRWTLRGPEAWHPFHLTHRSASSTPLADPPVVHGAFDQVPVYFRGFRWLAASVVLLMVLSLGARILGESVEGSEDSRPVASTAKVNLSASAQGIRVSWERAPEAAHYEIWQITPSLKRIGLRAADDRAIVTKVDDRSGQRCYSVMVYAEDGRRSRRSPESCSPKGKRTG